MASLFPPSAKIQVILFDLGHTLLYFDGDWPNIFLQAQEQVWQTLSGAGLRLDKARFLERLQTALENYYREREAEFTERTTAYMLRRLLEQEGHADIAESAIQQALSAMYAVTQAHWLPDRHAVSVLGDLQARGYRLGLVSNAAHDNDVQTLVDSHRLRPFFDIVLTSAAAGIRKPDPRIFHLALAHWDISPRQALMVGDTLKADILGARNAGIRSVWVRRYADTPANRVHADTIQADYQILSLDALPPLLDTLIP